jgi:polar amino acid transport system permease protein
MLPYAIPGMANLWLNATKDSALVAVVGYGELALATRQAAGGTKAYFLFYVVAAAIYLTISIVSLYFFSRVEHHYRRGQHRAR